MSNVHDCAHLHVTGVSEFVDDRPPLRNEVFLDILYSTRAHAKLKSIDIEDALEDSDVLAVYSGNDFLHNVWGTIFQDQPLLATDKVQFAGEAIAIIVGKSIEAAQYGKKKVKVEYEDLPPVLSIEEAKAANSYIADARTIERGDVGKAFKQASHILEGEIKIQGHDHFYLENQVSIAYPLENGQLEIHSSSQHPTETQHVVAHSLGLESKDVVCQVKRMGGGFGGKESQAAPFAAYAALVAQKLNRPARIRLTKDDDMIMTGKRNPFENTYKVAFDDSGIIQGLDLALFSDSGAYADLSTSIMERAMLHADNSYYIENLKVVGQVCKTNFHPHTAFRGFGGPKGVATIEIIIEKIAHKLGKDPLEIRKKNLYSDDNGRNITHYGQIFKNNCLEALFNQAEEQCHYQTRRQEVEKYNLQNSQYIKGLSLTSVKFGISFTTRFLNQANALVTIYKDGSLQISTGATEMGQGVNARIRRVVASEFGLDEEKARVMPTRTDKNANTSPTAASSGADLNAGAALLAARKIKRRLSEFVVKLFEVPENRWPSKTAGIGTEAEIKIEPISEPCNDPNEDADWKTGIATYKGVIFENGMVFIKGNSSKKISFPDLTHEAYLSRISISDYAHYSFPGIEFNKISGQGDAFLYFTQGVACSEVTLNKDSGEVKVDRVDVLMDLGRPINRDLDVGQVYGAFVQGMGWVTTENLYYDDQGLLISHAPSTYKIPNIQDTPRIFNVDLLQNEENFANVRGSKAVGEPPLLLAISTWTAINNALSYLPNYVEKYPQIKIPATNEEVLRAIVPDEFKKWDI